MMKKILRRVNAFATFEWQLNYRYLRQEFLQKHNQWREQYSSWSTKATRHKVVATYWRRKVPLHFLFLFGCALLINFFIHSSHVPNTQEISVIVLTAAFAFFTIYHTHYRPYFRADFLPKLETVIAEYEEEQLQQLELCRRQQLPVFSLVLLFYAFDKANQLNFLQSNDRVAKALNKLYGVDERGLKTNLSFLLSKPDSLSQKKLTTKRKEFEEAYNFLDDIQFTEGKKWLQALEQKLLSE